MANKNGKGILPQNELSEELLDGVSGGVSSTSLVGRGAVECACGVKHVDNIYPYLGKICKTCGEAYTSAY